MPWRDNYYFTPVNIALRDLRNAICERFNSKTLPDVYIPETFPRYDSKRSSGRNCRETYRLTIIDKYIEKLFSQSNTFCVCNSSPKPDKFIYFSDAGDVLEYDFSTLLEQAKVNTKITDSFFHNDAWGEQLLIGYPHGWLLQRIEMVNLLKYYMPHSFRVTTTYCVSKIYVFLQNGGGIATPRDIEEIERKEETETLKFCLSKDSSIPYSAKISNFNVSSQTLSGAERRYPGWSGTEKYVIISMPRKIQITLPDYNFTTKQIKCKFKVDKPDQSDRDDYYGVDKFYEQFVKIPYFSDLDSNEDFYTIPDSGIIEIKDDVENTINAIKECIKLIYYDEVSIGISIKLYLNTPYLDLTDELEYK